MSSKTVWGLGLLGLAMTAGVALHKQLPALEADLRDRVEVALKAEGIDDVNAEVSGLNVRLTLKMGATPPNAQARLDQAAQALRAIKGDWPQAVDAHVPADGGYLYGPVMEIVTDASENPISLSAGKTHHALSDL